MTLLVRALRMVHTSLLDKEKERIDDIRAQVYQDIKFSKDEEAHGLAIHRESIVVDSHFPGMGIMPHSERMIKHMEKMIQEGVSIGDVMNELDRLIHIDVIKDPQIRKIYVDSWKESGVTCANTALWPPGDPGFRGAVSKISESKNRIDNIDEINLALRTEDIRKAKKENKHTIIWNFENADILGGGFDVGNELNNIDLFYGLGVRAISLTYNLRNFLGDGCMERYQSGLSYFGIKVVERMNQLGMLIDISHSGSQTTIDAVDTSKVPIAATHTTCRALYDHPRGKTDEELLTITEKGGYVGICMRPQYLGNKYTLNTFLDHLDYAVELVGVDHVGIGTANAYRPFSPDSFSDLAMRGIKNPPSGSDWWLSLKYMQSKKKLDATLHGSLTWINWPYFTVALVTRGYSDEEIRGIIGGNFLNLLEKVTQ